jgi:hypothetical protein
MKLSIEQQKLADAIIPFTNAGGSVRFIIEQLIDRYWQPKPIDGPVEISESATLIESHTLKP